MDIDRLSLGVLAASDREVDWAALEEFELYKEALESVVDSLRPQVLECLRKAYLGDTGLYIRLSRTASNNPEEDGAALDPEGLNIDAYAYVSGEI